MRRRNFLSLLGAAAVAPALPALAGTAPAAVAQAGYNRFMYGLAVFHARTRAGLTTAELMTRLGVSRVQAGAMMSEMTARGVLSGLSGTAGSLAKPAAAPRTPYVRKALRNLNETITKAASDSDAVQSPATGDAQDVHASPPIDLTPTPTSCGPDNSGVR